MDQGFVASEGFQAPGAVTEAAAEVLARASGTAATTEQIYKDAMAVASRKPVGRAATGTKSGVAEVASTERAAEQRLNTTRNVVTSLGFVDLAGMLLATPFMWVAGKLGLNRVKVSFGGIKALMDGFHKTSVTQAGQLPANVMSAMAEQAKDAGVGHWAESAAKKSAQLATSGAAWQTRMGETFSPVLGALRGVATRVSESSVAKAMPNIVKSTFAKAGGVSMFGALMTAGVATGLGASLFAARANSKEADAAYKELIADLGGDANSAFAKAVKGARGTDKNWGLTKLGVDVVSGVAETAMWMAPGGGASMKMMGAMMIPQLCSGFVPENRTLGAYVALKKIEAGQLKVDTAQHMDLVKPLVALVPSVAANGGPNNMLGKYVAREMVERHMGPVQIIQLCNNPAQFNAFAAEVKAKQEAAKAAQKAALKDQPQVEGHAPGMTKAEAAYHAAEKPAGTMVTGSHKAEQGTVAMAPEMKRA